MLDAIYIYFLKEEMKTKILNAKVEKIYQISKDEILIYFRNYKDIYKVLMSSRSNSARFNITNKEYATPDTPPMFCMLLRKHLLNSRLVDIRQVDSERIVFFDFASVSEIGNPYTITLGLELMGRYSNIILIKDDVILDSIKRVGFEMSSYRQILPNLNYVYPPTQDKLSIFKYGVDEIIERVLLQNTSISKGIINSVLGISPIVARQILYNANIDFEIDTSNLSSYQKDSLLHSFSDFKNDIISKKCKPNILKGEDGRYIEFSFLDLSQYDKSFQYINYDELNRLLDDFYWERDNFERVKQKSAGLLKSINSLISKFQRKIVLQTQEIEDCKDRQKLKLKADLLNANIYKVKKGDTEITVSNFYSEENEDVKIELKPLLSPQQNLNNYYDAYKKTYLIEKNLITQIKNVKEDIIYLESVLYNLLNSSGDVEFEEIKRELIEGRYIKKVKEKKSKRKSIIKPIVYKSTDGFTIYAGKNNVQNDELTLKKANKNDFWFHTQKIHGSHVILVTDGKEVTDNAFTEAAMIAAYHSKAKNSSQVPVDYTNVRNVKKPSNAKPGMVIYENYHTAYVTCDFDYIDGMRV